ncbi:MAG: hypothetical protein JGK29_21635 [Microcoleus sp. PH2017_17_BER_D_A]|nr:hypothetical protein [Microcoleus sp. PH2017_17_BER_D_A]
MNHRETAVSAGEGEWRRLIASQLSDIMVAAIVCIVEFEWNVRSANVGCILVLGGH